MAKMVRIKTGKMVPIGHRSTSDGGKYTYEVQADGSIKELKSGRTTSPATGKAPAKAAAPKAKVAPVPAERKKAPVPAPRLDRTSAAPKGPAKRAALGQTSDAAPKGPARRMAMGSSASADPKGPARRATLGPANTSVATPTGPKGRGGKRGAKPRRSLGGTEYSGGIFGLDIIKGN